jgi:thioredoxin-related protein
MVKNLPGKHAWGCAILACVFYAAAGAVYALDSADDLAATGRLARERGLPIMLVFTRPDCPYCARAKRDYLEPLHAGQTQQPTVLLREIDVTNTRTALRGFSGEAVIPRELARKYDVRFVPTVLVVDPDGKKLADPIVGIGSADFYGYYLEQALEKARAALK